MWRDFDLISTILAMSGLLLAILAYESEVAYQLDHPDVLEHPHAHKHPRVDGV